MVWHVMCNPVKIETVNLKYSFKKPTSEKGNCFFSVRMFNPDVMRLLGLQVAFVSLFTVASIFHLGCLVYIGRKPQGLVRFAGIQWTAISGFSITYFSCLISFTF